MSPAWALLLVAVLIGANAFFVAFEFGLVAARQGVLEEAAAAGDRRAKAAVKQLSNLSLVLSAAQFGITVTSLVVGFLAEDAVGAVVIDPLLGLVGIEVVGGSRSALAVGLVFGISTVLQMLLGELAPKNLALAEPEKTALRLARGMRAFTLVFGPIIRLFDAAAAVLTRRVFGVEVADERLGGHSSDELARIIDASRAGGALSKAQGELLARAVALGDRRVHEVMVPRTRVEFLDADATVDALRSAARTTGYSRFPVRRSGEDDILGTVHVKDALQVDRAEWATTTVESLAAPAVVVPESDLLRRLLRRLRQAQRTFALVIDEYGGVAGIVTVEDVLEELVGEIEDEFDAAVGPVRQVGTGSWLLDGAVRVDQIGELFGAPLPEGDFETIAGFVIDQLGRIPRTGATVQHNGVEYVAQRMDGVRLAQVLVRVLDDADTTDGTDGSAA